MGRFNRGFHNDPKLSKKKRQLKAARLIVRNLPFTSTEDNVKEHFIKFGEVLEVTLLRNGNKLVGCGFVQFKNKASAAAAIQKASGKPFLGRTIIADWAVSKNNFEKSRRNEIKKEIKKEPKELVKEEVSSQSDSDDGQSNKPNGEQVIKSEEESVGSDSDSENSCVEEVKEEKASSSEETEGDDDVSSDREASETGESDDDSDAESSGEGDDSDEDVKPNVKKIKKRKIDDVLEGKTVFIKNVPFLATEEELEKAVKTFGPIAYAKICMDQLTEHSKGTAFVKFIDKKSADACLAAGTEFTLNGTVLDPHPAIPKKEIHKKQTEPKKPSDSRNLYLLKEGVVNAGSKAAEGVSASDMAKRLQIERWKREIIKDLGKFVSRYRLVIHNIPLYYDDKRVAALIKKYCPKDAKFKQVRVMRDLKDLDASGIGKSKGFAFVSFDKHEDALATLRNLNNNPSVFKPQKRPIVSFSVESKKAMKIKEIRLEKSRLPQKVENSQPPVTVKVETEEKKKLNKKDKNQKVDHTVNSKSESDFNSDKTNYAGTFATPGTKKFMNNLNARQQALLHRKHLKKEKTKSNKMKKKIPRKERKALKKQNMTRQKKINSDEVEFTKLVSKYRSQITSGAEKKKWFQ